jgi:hypothetical protein
MESVQNSEYLSVFAYLFILQHTNIMMMPHNNRLLQAQRTGTDSIPIDEGHALLPERPLLLTESVSKQLVSQARLSGGAVRPLYGSLCFSSLPGLIEKSLLGETRRSCPDWLNAKALGDFDRVVFVFFDAFGWESFERFRDDSAALQRFNSDGLVLQTTSQFPSTTATHVTTIMSGKSGYEHEVCGWDYYEPRAGRVIRPLKYLDSALPDTSPMSKLQSATEDVLPGGDFLTGLMRAGVELNLHGPAAYFPSTYSSRYVSAQACQGYQTLEEGFGKVAQNLRQSGGKSYDYVYIDSYDTACHKEGVGGRGPDEVARFVLAQINGLIEKERHDKTLLIVSADHGQIANKPGGSLKLQDFCPDIASYLKRDSRGEPIRFSGGPRYLFLHAREDAAPALINQLSDKFADTASILNMEELGGAGFLGPTPVANSYLERLGTIAILPNPGYSVAWHEPPVFTKQDYSGHGGVSPQEMETPLLLLPLS